MINRKRSVFTLLALTAAFTLTAQDYTKVWLNKKGDIITDSTQATRYAHVFDEGELVKMDEYSLGGVLKDTWYYSLNENAKPKFQKESLHTRYYANGTDSLTENYHNNKRHGECTVYYIDGACHSVRLFEEGKLNGKFVQYYPDGSLRREEYYTEGNCTAGKLFAENGSELPHQPYYIHTTFKGGVGKFVGLIANTVSYPKEIARKGITGKVLVEFIVDYDGSIIDPVVVQSVHYDLDKEAIDAVKRIAKKHKWTPAFRDGEPMRVKFTAPVNFKI